VLIGIFLVTEDFENSCHKLLSADVYMERRRLLARGRCA
jgi:hypothetical protein